MSRHLDLDPRCESLAASQPIQTLIVPRARDIGGFAVRRALPSARRQMVGPFIFLDQMGPAEFLVGDGLDVRPHPHIGLATVTYLLAGEILHRDSLGTLQPIRPGEVNWMTAGRGVAHSERTSPEARRSGGRLFGLQAWVALPEAAEETEPTFTHHDRVALPVIAGEGKEVRLIVGSLYGATSPVPTFSAMFYADVHLATGTKLPVPPEHEERALYLVDGEIEITGDRFVGPVLLVLSPGDSVTVTACTASRLMLLGGAPMEGPRYVWWNFVSSSKERIDAAKADWQAGHFDPIPGEEEPLPLPSHG